MFFTLYSRVYCHLCDEMLQELRALDVANRFVIEVVDVDNDPELLVRFDELVPVLFVSKNDAAPVQLCHYFLDEAKLREFLEE